jgi:acylphosphatase
MVINLGCDRVISKINMRLMEKRIKGIHLPIFSKEDKIRQRIIFYGKVKRVAFRNEVYLMGLRLGISGFVYNDKKSVVLEIEAEPNKITYLINHLKIVSRFKITFIDITTIGLKNETIFYKTKRP